MRGMATSSSTPISLLELARLSPDGPSWHQLVEIYGGLIEKWLVQRGLPQQDVDDVRQEVMAVVVRELPRFEHNGRTGAFRNWLRTITANRLSQFWDKKARNRAVTSGPSVGEMAEQLQDPQSDISLMWEVEHDRFVLEQLLQMISNKFQEKSVTAFRWLALEQREADQVAADLGLTINAVRIAQSRVLRALRDLGAGLIE